MRKNIITYSLLFLSFAIASTAKGQETVMLDQILNSVIDDSYSVRTAQNQVDIADAGYDFFKSLLKPNVGLNASLPRYSKTFSPVIQPDGTVTFTSIKQANSNLSLFATQVVPSTGATIFLSSDIQRFDDFSFNSKQYNGNPIRLGINQPIFGFNPWKYREGIESLRKEEARMAYKTEVEGALSTATDLYFNILIAKQNLEIAKTNKLVNEKLLDITNERLALGRVSRDEKLQLEIELNNAKLNESQAGFQVSQAIARLYTFLSSRAPEDNTTFEVPDLQATTIINVDALLDTYQKNRPEVIAYQRNKQQTAMDLAEAKAEYGIQADLQVSLGLARGSDQFSEVYTDPFDEQQFNVSLTVPILDWGKRKSALKQIEIRQRDIDADFEQQFLQLENNIRQQALRFDRLQSEIKLLREIMEKAEERFTISNERYVLGNIDITNLTLAQREKDQTKRSYINALKSYWVTYYDLRALSGYDIITNQEIIY